MSEFAVSVLAFAVAVGSAGVAVWSVIYARRSANASVVSADAATRTADLAEVVEMGRHHGWRIEARTNDPTRFYALRNVGTINARDVKLSGDFYKVGFLQQDGDEGPVDIASGQARLFSVKRSYSRRGGELHITWTPDLPGAEPMAWTGTADGTRCGAFSQPDSHAEEPGRTTSPLRFRFASLALRRKPVALIEQLVDAVHRGHRSGHGDDAPEALGYPGMPRTTKRPSQSETAPLRSAGLCPVPHAGIA